MKCCNLQFCVPSFTTDTLSTPDPVTDVLNSPNDLSTLHRNILELVSSGSESKQPTNLPAIPKEVCLKTRGTKSG